MKKVDSLNDTQTGKEPPALTTRRGAVKATAAGASVLAGVAIPAVHAQGNEELNLALVGCGGRGTGAVKNALSVSGSLGPLKLHAAVDVFPDKMDRSLEVLAKQDGIADKIDVPNDRKFIGFEGYRHAMDSMNPGDIAILTTPCAFRWPMFEYAVEKGLNVFMEKPVTPDGFSSRKMLEINEKAREKNLKVGVGLMCRHCASRSELNKRIQDGAIGEITMLRSYRAQGPVGSCFTRKNPGEINDLQYQIRNFHSFLWLSGGSFSDFFIHGIDECCWIKGAWPVKAQAQGGRHYREDDQVDQNFDSYSVEYTFEDGTKFFYDGRNMKGCRQEFAAYAHGTKGSAVISTAGHVPARSRIYSDQNISNNWRAKPENLVWAFPQTPREPNPYDLEWEHLLDAIRNDLPFNEVERGVAASVTTSMGRMAAHTGQEITYDQMLNCEHTMAPNVKELMLEGDSPLLPDEDGFYPIPEPGVKRDREY